MIAIADRMSPVDASAAARFTELLLARWPWLESTKQNLTVLASDYAMHFANSSTEAARHVLHPLTAPEWEGDRPPHPNALRRELRGYDNQVRGAARVARMLLDETERRRRQQEADERIASEKASFAARHGGKSPVEVLREFRARALP